MSGTVKDEEGRWMHLAGETDQDSQMRIISSSGACGAVMVMAFSSVLNISWAC